MLGSNETELIGHWIVRGHQVVADDVCRRIDELTTMALMRIADGDWSVLYRDPRDGRLWEKTYPQSYLHGGGPPALKCISHEEVYGRYGALPNVALDAGAKGRRST